MRIRLPFFVWVLLSLGGIGFALAADSLPRGPEPDRHEKPKSPLDVEVSAEPVASDPSAWRVILKARSPFPDSQALIELELPLGMLLVEGAARKVAWLEADRDYVFEYLVEVPGGGEGTLVGRVSLVDPDRSFEREAYLKLGSSAQAREKDPYKVLRTREGEPVMKY